MNAEIEYSKFGGHDRSTGLLFWQTQTMWRRKFKAALAPHGVTHTQYVILAVTEHLNVNNCAITQKSISDFSMIDVMTVSSSLRLLEKNGFIVRVGDEVDTRAKAVQITDKGKTILKTVLPLVESVDEQFFSLEPSEYQALQTLLKKLLFEHKK